MKSKIKGLADLISHEEALPGTQMTAFSLCSHLIEGMKELSRVFFIRTLISCMQTPLS